MDSQSRNRSVDRVPARDASLSRENHRESRLPGRATPPPGREHGHGGSAFLSGLRSSSTKAAGMFGKSFFGKAHRSGSTNERLPMDDEHYELKVINLPLVAQTRKTRISKRLEDSRDKTEFWMPAFPWRAIDYLNYKGCEVEGLYRVPGSGPQIKKWQRRFDECKFLILPTRLTTGLTFDCKFMTSICLRQLICMISISLVPCSRLGYESSPMSCSQRPPRNG